MDNNGTNNTENLTNITTNPNMQPSNEVNLEKTSVSDEEEVGEHDIVIEEDFQINMDIAEISDSMVFNDSSSEGENNQSDAEVNIGTEQSGNITF